MSGVKLHKVEVVDSTTALYTLEVTLSVQAASEFEAIGWLMANLEDGG